jgi:hypothetical protein
VGSCKESQTADIDHHIVTDHRVLRNYPTDCWDSLADTFFKGLSVLGTIALDDVQFGHSLLPFLDAVLSATESEPRQSKEVARRQIL